MTTLLTIYGVPKLTKRQQLVLAFIARQVDDYGYPPTIREIGDGLRIKSTNGVCDHLKALERKGYLVRVEADKTRAIKVLRDPTGKPWQSKDELILELRLRVSQLAAQLAAQLVTKQAG